MKRALFIPSAVLCGNLVGCLIHPVFSQELEALAPLPGHACARLRGTPAEMLTKRVPLYDRADPQARLPLVAAGGQPAIAPFTVLVHVPERVEHGMVAMTTYDHREGWIAASALGPPLPLPGDGRSGNPPKSCQPLIMSNGAYGAG